MLTCYVDAVSTYEIDGECLCRCNKIKNIRELGITGRVKASILLERINEFKADGVPSEFLSPPPAGYMCDDWYYIYDNAYDWYYIYDNSAISNIRYMMTQLWLILHIW